MNAIMNEKAHKSFMICHINIDELTRLYEMLCVFINDKCLILRH
jgi:hypothetical protein